jgi:hypothetical protein
MPKFMLFTRDALAQPEMSAEEAQAVMQKYIDWSINLKKRSQVFAADKLMDNEGRVLRSVNGTVTITDGPFLESKEVLGGYWIFEAANYDEALEIVSDHPTLFYGGTLELREVDPT